MKIRVMIIEDSILQRAMIRSMLEKDKAQRFEVIASAHNGIDAMEKLKRHKDEIDVITLDVEMPKMNGLETLDAIMRYSPKPILMFSSLTQKGAKETIEALSKGAVDFITKPDTKEVRSLEKELLEKIYLVSKAKIPRKNKLNSNTPLKQIIPNIESKNKHSVAKKLSNIILIGASTGGPRSLSKVMARLPKDLNAAIIIVQHMQTGGFTASFAKSLDQISPFKVTEAKGGEELVDGVAFVSPAGTQTIVTKANGQLKIALTDKFPSYRHKPSVDVLFTSLSNLQPPVPVFGVVLTGMGDDGSNGCEELKKINATIFAESERTAILYGMPKQVAKRGLADYVEDLDDIIPSIYQIIKST